MPKPYSRRLIRAGSDRWVIRRLASSPARFAEAIEHLRAGPQQPGIEEIDDNLYAYSFNGYRIAFEIVSDAPDTLRIIIFEPEEPAK